MYYEITCFSYIDIRYAHITALQIEQSFQKWFRVQNSFCESPTYWIRGSSRISLDKMGSACWTIDWFCPMGVWSSFFLGVSHGFEKTLMQNILGSYFSHFLNQSLSVIPLSCIGNPSVWLHYLDHWDQVSCSSSTTMASVSKLSLGKMASMDWPVLTTFS